MAGLAAGVRKFPEQLPPIVLALLTGLNASAVGLIALAAFQLSRTAITDKLTRLLVLGSASFGICYHAPWVGVYTRNYALRYLADLAVVSFRCTLSSLLQVVFSRSSGTIECECLILSRTSRTNDGDAHRLPSHLLRKPSNSTACQKARHQKRQERLPYATECEAQDRL